MPLYTRVATRILLMLLSLVMIGCQLVTRQSIPSVQERNNVALGIAEKGGFRLHSISTPLFNLASFEPSSIQGEALRVYIEGDGAAWRDSQTPSLDPTPGNPMGLRLALADPSFSSVYLARPCQYQLMISRELNNLCSSRFWTNERFSEQVVTSLNHAVDQLKQRFHAKKIILIGYSGGGALAILCAAKRSDVTAIVTVAGNVSIREWVKTMGVEKLHGSLDPVDYVKAVQGISQWHFVGSDDEIVPPSMVQSYISHFPKNAPIQVITVEGFSHQCCWDKNWTFLSKKF